MMFRLLAHRDLVRLKRSLGPDQSDPATLHRSTV
jgi:hypothetical protein